MPQDAKYFQNLTDDQLAYAIEDISRAMDFSRGWHDDGAGECKYADQYWAAVGERNRRASRYTALEYLGPADGDCPLYGCRDSREEFCALYGGKRRTREQWVGLLQLFSEYP